MHFYVTRNSLEPFAHLLESLKAPKKNSASQREREMRGHIRRGRTEELKWGEERGEEEPQAKFVQELPQYDATTLIGYSNFLLANFFTYFGDQFTWHCVDEYVLFWYRPSPWFIFLCYAVYVILHSWLNKLIDIVSECLLTLVIARIESCTATVSK